MPTGPHVTSDVTDLITKLLVKNPLGRLGSEKPEDLLSHPLFRDVEMDKTYEHEPALHPKQKVRSK